MNENLNEALEHISDRHLAEAIQYHQRPALRRWLGAIAAVLAVIIAWGAIWHNWPKKNEPEVPLIQGTVPSLIPAPAPLTPPNELGIKSLVAAPVYPELVLCPKYDDFDNYQSYDDALDLWKEQQKQIYDQPRGYADSLDSFFAASIPEFLSGEGNRAYSPLNVYMAMAMLAQTTGGNSRQQILDLFGVDSIEALQTQADHVWTAHYRDDGQRKSLLANSVWLDTVFPYKEENVQTLADKFYTSVFHADLGTEEADRELRDWLNSQTGGLLSEQAEELKLDPLTVFALASTCYFSAGWSSEFDPEKNEDRVFHCKDADLMTQFMNKTIQIGTYYWGEDFGAVKLGLNGGNKMWLILPDEGKTVEDVLQSGEYWELTQNYWKWERQKKLKVNLSLPKFDISTQADLIDGMKNLGVTNVFDPNTSDFSSITDMDRLCVGKIDHAVRVAIDEEGVIAASYTVVEIVYEGVPDVPEDEIDFTLDRPFVFLVTSQDNLPLFTGVVEQP